MITFNDKRTQIGGSSLGAPAQEEASDFVHVEPTTTYLEGSKLVGPGTPHPHPYRVPRHQGQQLEANGFARIVASPKLPPAGDAPAGDGEEEGDGEGDIEQPDDTSRVPAPDQETASTVPARPGAEPQRPSSGPVPPAAVSTAPSPAGRRRRSATKQG